MKALKIMPLCLFMALLCACGPGDAGPTPTPTPDITPIPTATPSPSPTASPPAVEPEWDEPQITAQEYHESFTESDGYVLLEASVMLPAVETGTAAGERITAYYTGILEAERTESETIAETSRQSYREIGASGATYSLDQSYRVLLMTDELISIVRERHIYTGGVHGGTLVYGETFDMQTGDMIFLDSIFAVSADEYHERLYDALIEIADKRGMEDDLGSGYEERIRQFFDPGNFALTGDGLAIWYQEYDIGPYAAGTPTFIVPYDAIADILAITPPGAEA